MRQYGLNDHFQVLAIMGLIAGIVLVASGKIAFAGVIWAVTVILTSIENREIQKKWGHKYVTA